MNKLYIDQQGIIKVIDVPEEPTVGGRTYQGVADPGTYNAMKSDYQRALAAAKEAGIEVQNREQVVREVFTRPVTGEIVSIPEGWRVEIKEETDQRFSDTDLELGRIPCGEVFSSIRKVAVLLPPVSEKEDVDKMFNEWIGEKKVHDNRNRCNLSDDELLRRCDEWVRKLCNSGGRDWCLRVPVDFDNDPDMLFVELILRYRELHKSPEKVESQEEL